MTLAAAIEQVRSKRAASAVRRCHIQSESSAEARLQGQATNAARAAERVRAIGPIAMQLKEEGLSLSEIAAVLEELGHRDTASGKTFTRFQVRRILDRMGR